MADKTSLFEQAADVLRRAMTVTDGGQQSFLLEEALRLNRLALTAEAAKAPANSIMDGAPPTPAGRAPPHLHP